VAEPNVGLMAHTVSTPASVDRLLTLHCSRSGRCDEGEQRVVLAHPRDDMNDREASAAILREPTLTAPSPLLTVNRSR
jgi:hypothetical protein